MEENKDYKVYRFDYLTEGSQLKFEHSVYCEDVDISSLITQGTDALEALRQDSMDGEQKAFEIVQAAAKQWEQQAAVTQKLNRALEYLRTPEVAHTANQWQPNQNNSDWEEISNRVYKMSCRIREDLLLSLLIALLVISYLLGKLHRVRGQLFLIRDALNDIKAGNLNRRVLARESDLTKQICYDINEIAMSSQSRLIQQKQSEQAYKRLMTSLSHDVKTPLASLVGYLEAVESKMVTGAEKEEYIRVAMEKAYHLKDFVTALFEWVKLDAGEQIFHFEVCDLNELSRDIMADWVPLLENHDLSYEIEIPETEYMTRVDSTAYTRILNNLLQNILTHSDASKVFLTVTETEQQAKIVVADNGNGIAASDLPHIFERMYQCDHSRSAKGNGLGLSIAKELVSIHKGTITAASVPGNRTTFIIILPKAL